MKFSRINNVLIVDVIIEDDQNYFPNLIASIVRDLKEHHNRALVINLARMEVIDPFSVQDLIKLIRISTLVGVRAIISGMSPGVADFIVSIGAETDDLETSLNIDSALALLEFEDSDMESLPEEVQESEIGLPDEALENDAISTTTEF